jgi:ribosomal protein S14
VINWVSGRVRCLGGKHERSEKHIRASEDDRFVSRCRFCGVPMKRRAKRDWIVISRTEFRDARNG